MVWNSVGDFLHMGGYGLYVWGSVAVTFGVMLSEVVLLRFRRMSAQEQIARRRAYDEGEVVADDDSGGAR